MGCSQSPADVAFRGKQFYGEKDGSVSSPVTRQSQEYKNAHYKVRARAGDTVFALSRRENVPVLAIMEANQLRPPYVIQKGQMLLVPKMRNYKVKKGDNLFEISRKHHMDMVQIARLNNLRKPYRLEVGQFLRIPHVRYKASPNKAKSYTKNVSKQKTTQPVQVSRPNKTDNISASKPSSANNTKLAHQQIRSKPKVRSAKTDVTYKATKAGYFEWPARGKILSRFGAVGKGNEYNDGIAIALPAGSPIKSAASGTVVYNGNGLKGYGNLLIIRHSGGWLTAYAHLKSVKVGKGDRVNLGQIIAEVGKTGDVSRPQLYFAIRKKNKALDPMKHL